MISTEESKAIVPTQTVNDVVCDGYGIFETMLLQPNNAYLDDLYLRPFIVTQKRL